MSASPKKLERQQAKAHAEKHRSGTAYDERDRRRQTRPDSSFILQRQLDVVLLVERAAENGIQFTIDLMRSQTRRRR